MDERSIQDLDKKHLWHPYTRHTSLNEVPFPTIERGEGIYLFDREGNRYLDAISSWWACNLGHSHPRLVNAIQRQAEHLQHSILGNMSHQPAIDLADGLAALMPDPDRHVLFAADGACAVEAALRVAVQHWANLGESGRTKLVSLEKAYHGDTFGAMSVGYLPEFHQPYQPFLFPALRARQPGREDDHWASMESILDTHGDTIAAVIIEPLCQCAAGMNMYLPDYLVKLARACKEKGILFIVDEVATGFGRTGRMFAFEHAGIDPDIVVVGKALSGGMLPMSAAIVKNYLYESFSDEPVDHTFYHGHTFAGNPIAASVSLETLSLYREECIPEKARALGETMRDVLMEADSLEGVREVRCLGMIGAIEVHEDKTDQLRTLCLSLRKEGILVRPLGPVVYLMPPLVTPEKTLADLSRKLVSTVQQLDA